MGEPRWMTVARSKIGVTELSGPASNPVIVGWAAKIGGWIKSFFANDGIPWCGLFVGYCLLEAGIKPPQTALGALQWGSWGRALAKGAPGAILVFKRAGGGHVGFYAAEDATAYHVLGGNQSDAVNIKRIAKARCVAIRWPAGVPEKPGAPVNANAGGALSTNEA